MGEGQSELWINDQLLICHFIGINENVRMIEVYVLTGKMWAQENNVTPISNIFFFPWRRCFPSPLIPEMWWEKAKGQPEIYPSVGAGLKVMIPWQSSYLSCTGVFAMSKFLRKPGQCSCPIRVLKSTIPGLAAALGTGFSLPGAVRCRFAGCRCGLFALASAGRFRAGCVSGHQGDNETLMFLKILIWKGWWMWKAGINVLEAEPASMARFEFWLLGELMFDPHSHI